MKKINWEISREGYGPQREVVASTRSLALATAEAEWLKDNSWQNEILGGRPEMPDFTARKIS